MQETGRELYFVIPTYRLRAVPETVQHCDQHSKETGTSSRSWNSMAPSSRTDISISLFLSRHLRTTSSTTWGQRDNSSSTADKPRSEQCSQRDWGLTSSQ